MHLRNVKWFPGLATIGVSALLVMLVLPDSPPGWDDVLSKMNERRIQKFTSAKGVRKHIPAIEFYYISRWYGNPGVNIELERYKALSEIEGRLNKGFDKATEDNAWRALGPGNIAGRVRAIAFRPDDPNIVYAGGASGGIFKSTNGGQGDWRPIMDFADAIPVGAIAIDPVNPDIMYAGTGEPTADLYKVNSGPSFSGVGVLKSTDAGESWTRLPWPQSTSAIHRILIDPRNPSVVLVASRANMYRSEDGGQTWTRSQGGVITDLEFKPGNPDIVYLAIGKDDGAAVNGVYRSTDNGKAFTWTKLATNFPATDSLGRIELAVSPASPDLLLAFVIRKGFYIGDNDFLGMMKSTNGGENWVRVASNLPGTFTNGQGFYDLCASIAPTSADTIHAGGLELWRSVNGGSSWTQLSSHGSPVHVDQHVLEYSPDNKYLFLGNDGGVYRSLNKGTTWTPLDKTLETIQFYTLAWDPNNADRFYGGVQDHGIFQSSNVDTKEWRIRRGGDGGYVVVDPTNPNILYSRLMIEGAGNPVPARSINGGQSWTRLENGFSGDRFNWLPPMMLAPNDRTRLYTATQFVYSAKPADSGTPTWRAISPDLTARNSISSVISTIDVSVSSPTTMYVGCGDGVVQVSTNITAADVEWKNITAGLPNRWVTRIKIDKRNAAIAYAVFSGINTPHVYKTTNFGESWTDISGNLPNLPINGIVISRDDPDNTLFVGTDIGVWFTRDGGQNWARFGSGLPNVVVYDVDIDAQNRLIAATFGRGMWIASAVINSVPTATPDVFALRQNYPNPFAAAQGTTISFTLKETTDIRLALHDAAGRRVRTLREGRMAGGSHSLTISTNDLRNGVYFYTISDGRQSSMKKMVVLN